MSDNAAIEEGRYRDAPEDELIPGLDGEDGGAAHNGSETVASEDTFYGSSDNEEQVEPGKAPGLMATPTNGNVFPDDRSNGNITSFPSIRSPTRREEQDIPSGVKGWIPMTKLKTRQGVAAISHTTGRVSQRAFGVLPRSLQKGLTTVYSAMRRFFGGLWEFMNPPLWAMLAAVVVASIPDLQRLFFADGSFIANSVTRAVSQSGGVAVPLILVVLGANLARNTLPQDAHSVNSEDAKIEKKLLVASLISRMLLPTLIMAPMLALTAKYVPVSILDDPIFVIVCFLLTGAPSALQLAQICQINGVYEGVMSKLLFQSYVIWYVLFASQAFCKSLLTSHRILPSTLVLVMCALEVVEWANDLN